MNKSELEVFVTSANSLATRLPELEWKLSKLAGAWNKNKLPPGLFRSALHMTPGVCINEIKENLVRLSQQDNPRTTYLLANKIHQQINVLVRICTMHYSRPSNQHVPTKVSVDSISTRQKWLNGLREEVNQLTVQYAAVEQTLLQYQKNVQFSDLVLQLSNELGEIQRRLTLSQERLDREISFSSNTGQRV